MCSTNGAALVSEILLNGLTGVQVWFRDAPKSSEPTLCRNSTNVGRLIFSKPLVRPRRKSEDNIKMYLQKEKWAGWGRDLIDLAQDRERWRELVDVVMNRRVS